MILVPSLLRPGSNSNRARAVTFVRESLVAGDIAMGSSELMDVIVGRVPHVNTER